MKKIEKAKRFVKEHKKELAVGAITVVVGGVIFMITKKRPNAESLGFCIFKDSTSKDLEIPKVDLGTITDLWQEGERKMLVMDEFTVGDMGAVGEQLLKIDGVSNDTTVGIIAGLVDKVEDNIEVTEF